MRDFLKSSGRWLSVGWLWPLVLLALPNCALDSSALPPTQQFDPGPEPKTSAVMCDIPKPGGKHCASDAEIAMGITLSEAGLVFRAGVSSSVGLDYSPSALSACSGKPMATVFFGPFPDGYAACLNCGTQIPSVFADGNAVCVAQCEDLINFSEGPFPADQTVTEFCEANAHVSTNFDKNTCYPDACSVGGTLRSDFVDPRRTPDPVKWIDQIGTSAVDGSLTRTAPATGPDTTDFNAGAASDQLIKKLDAWVEFEASENDLSHVLGLSSTPCDPCSDQNPSLTDIDVSISLNSDGRVYLLEKDQLVQGPDINGSYGTYSPGERFAIWVQDNFDGSAKISFWRVSGPCTPNSACISTLLDYHAGPAPVYPLRVDASFREQNATLANATVERIK